MSHFIVHSAFTEPGGHAGAIRELPDDIASIVRTVRGLLLHGDYLEIYGVESGLESSGSRETLSCANRLDQIFRESPKPLWCERAVEHRQVGTCRDYALLICSVLREKRVPARVRCGFAGYLSPARYEDHWVCEYFLAAENRWVRVDGQLDTQHCHQLGIGFDTVDLPDRVFLSAKQAWEYAQDHQLQPRLFGHGDARGEWFIWVNLARDFFALRGNETSDWDTWRSIQARDRNLSRYERGICDALADDISKLELELPIERTQSYPRPFWPGDG